MNGSESSGRVRQAEARLRQWAHERRVPPGGRLPSVRELAAELAVSESTIHAALRVLKREGVIVGHQGKGLYIVDPEVRPRIRHRIVGVVVEQAAFLTHPVQARRISGIQRVLTAAGFQMLIVALHGASQLAPPARQRLTSRDTVVNPELMDGVILLGLSADLFPPGQREVAVANLCRCLPVIAYDLDFPGGPKWPVRALTDFELGAFRVTQHLLERGHRRLALITGAPEHTVAQAQARGAALAVRAHAEAPSIHFQTWFSTDGFTVPGGLAILKRLARADQPFPTALIAGADDLALGLYNGLQKKGMKVPQDVTLTGWNDLLTTAELPVPLTTLRSDYEGGGAWCAEQLLRMLADATYRPEDILFPCNLILRD